MVDPGFSERGAHRCKISARLCAKNFFTRLWPFLGKLSCTTVILISGHTKKGGGHVPEMPTPRSTTAISRVKGSMMLTTVFFYSAQS